MTTVEEFTVQVTELTEVVDAIDSKLDEVRTFIGGLSAGSVVTQEQLDTLSSLIGVAKDKAAAVLAEADALDLPA